MKVALTDLDLPMTFSSLVVETNSRCNAKCAMCYQSAGPKGSDLIGDHRLGTDDVKDLLRSAVDIKEIGRRFHTSGGAAFLRPDDLFAVFEYAKGLEHFQDISTTTNAYWAATKRKAMRIAQQAAQSGVTMMEISWDHWHGPYVSAHAVSNCIDACVEHGIEPHLRLLTTKSHTAAEALSRLRPESVERASNIHSCPVFSTGRAAREIDADEFHHGCADEMAIAGACHSALNLTVNARGDVYPCCAGADQTQGLAFGNIHDQPLREIVDEMQASPMLRVLVFSGVAAFYPILQQAEIQIRPRYHNMCEFCTDIFSRPDAAAAIKRHFDDATACAIAAALRHWADTDFEKTLQIA
ncbi:radical SAM/SPASM domain-containing protein [Rhodoferax sp.]|uniref:radical SAM/SPASM domain-containing protein n=1 Tax=Rhodoferax sp. TaxID=50421 RepID=UPI002756B659|nr:SPASM domain-containing protein [Rhodoferax sp.]